MDSAGEDVEHGPSLFLEADPKFEPLQHKQNHQSHRSSPARQIEPRGAEKSEPIAPADDGAQSQGAEPR